MIYERPDGLVCLVRGVFCGFLEATPSHAYDHLWVAEAFIEDRVRSFRIVKAVDEPCLPVLDNAACVLPVGGHHRHPGREGVHYGTGEPLPVISRREEEEEVAAQNPDALPYRHASLVGDAVRVRREKVVELL